MSSDSINGEDPTWPAHHSPIPFRVQATHAPGWDQLTLEGELDLASAPILQSELDRLERDPASMIVLDLRQLSFMDVAGLRALLEAHQRALGGWWSLVIVRGPRAVQRVFELAKVEQFLHLIDDLMLAQPERLLCAH
jgi:anti-sigma B factor antagonist